MSVTIVSSPPKSTQVAPPDTASGSAIGSEDPATVLDFASLLFAQLGSVAQGILPASPVPTEKPEAIATEATATADAADAAGASALFAALGFVPAEQQSAIEETAHNAGTPLTGLGKIDQTSANALASQQSTADIEAVKTEPAVNGTLVADDKPAKFAADVTTVRSMADGVPPPALNPQAPATPNIRSNKPEISLSVASPVRDQNWSGDFAQKIVWLAANDKQTAQLTLNPPQMGPIEISLKMDKTNATASFFAANADVREAIESALPRLREMLASTGIELGQANVSAESFRQPGGNGDGYRSPSQRTADNAILVSESAGTLPSRGFGTQQGNGLVDIFA